MKKNEEVKILLEMVLKYDIAENEARRRKDIYKRELINKYDADDQAIEQLISKIKKQGIEFSY